MTTINGVVHSWIAADIAASRNSMTTGPFKLLRQTWERPSAVLNGWVRFGCTSATVPSSSSVMMVVLLTCCGSGEADSRRGADGAGV